MTHGVSSQSLAARLKSRHPVFGAWTSLGHPSITEMFTRSGVDFIGIDLEHSTISQEQAQRLIAASQAAGVACLPRLASHNKEQASRLLDSGADGLIVPNVTTVVQAVQAVEWCTYPPLGKRSYGVARAQGYGVSFEEYAATWNERAALLLQIESLQGVEAIEELLRLDAVSGVMIGPYDLSGSLGIPGQLEHPRVRSACARVIKACREARKACGTQLIEPAEANIAAAFARGYTFVVLASDVFVLWKWAERMRALVAAPHRSNRRSGRRVPMEGVGGPSAEQPVS